MATKYPASQYPSRVWFSNEDECYLAQAIDYPSIVAAGDSAKEAARELYEVLEVALGLDAQAGNAPKVPTTGDKMRK